MEIIFTRPDDDPEWERRITSEHVPMPGNLVRFPDETGDMSRGTTYKVDETIWYIHPDSGVSQVEVMLIDV